MPRCTHRQYPNQCIACLKCFTSINSLSQHKHFCKSIKEKLSCEYCHKIFSLEKFRLQHYKICEMKIKKEAETPIIIQEVSVQNNPIGKKRKQSISATIKRLVWNTHIGEEIGKTKCLCCKVTDITQLSFNCGHIIAEANNGKIIVSNLKPICSHCNSSMGTKNMDDFMATLI